MNQRKLDALANHCLSPSPNNLPNLRMKFSAIIKVIFLAVLIALGPKVIAAPGDLDLGFNPNANGMVYAAAQQPNGKIIIGGGFTTIGGVTRNRLARLSLDGALDATFTPSVGGIVYCVAVMDNGKIFIGGSFNSVNGTARNNLARLNSDGSLDASFNLPVDSSSFTLAVYCMAPQVDGSIVIGGDFTTVGGTARSYLAKLNPSGNLDLNFLPTPSSRVHTIVNQPDGKIVTGGNFTSYGGVSRAYLARLNPNGSLDTTFTPKVSSTVHCAALQADGKIVIGGYFYAVGDLIRNRVARVHTDGAVDIGFNPNADDYIYTCTIGTNAKIPLAGDLSNVGGFPRSSLAVLNGDGSVDNTFAGSSIPTIYGGSVYLMPQSNGELIVMGGFSTVNGITRNQIARIRNEPGTQSLSVTHPTRIQWLRGGSTPESSQVTFELSVDGTTWTQLAPPTRISLGWELGGLDLPATGRVRARARTIGGQYNGSSGLLESTVGFGSQPDIVLEQPSPTVVADEASRNFGSLQFGTQSTMTFTVRNSGVADLVISGVEIDGPNAADFTPSTITVPVVLPPSASTTFTVKFEPTGGGSRNASLHVLSNVAGEKNSYDVALSGNAMAADISVENQSTQVSDGGSVTSASTVFGSSSLLALTIRNPGTANLVIPNVTFDGANPSDFNIVSLPSTPILPGESATIAVQIAPSAIGSRTATMHMVSNVPGAKNPFDISLTSTATASSIEVEQPTLTSVADGGNKDFGSTAVGVAKNLTFTIRNSGNATLSGFGFTFDGPNASDFAITSNPTSVSQNSTTSFTLRFQPTGGGPRSASLNISSNVVGSKNPYTINLTGLGLLPEISVEQPALSVIGNGGSKDFGTVSILSNTSLTFIIKNAGTAPLSGLTVSKDGTNPGDFLVTTAPPTASVAPGDSVSFVVRFSPSANGPRAADFHITSTVAGANLLYDIDLKGTGSGPGSSDSSFTAQSDNFILSTLVQPDQKLLVGGGFTTLGSTAKNYVARLNADSSLDAAFNSNPNDWVLSSALQSDGKTIIGGSFTTIGGVIRNYIARVNGDGSLDATFDPNANDWVYSALLQQDGKIIIAGSFTTVGGVTRDRLARLNPDGTLDSSFGPEVNGNIYTVALQPDGKMVIGGSFTSVESSPRYYVARINANGTLDETFDPVANSSVYCAAIQADGKILIGGMFTTVDGLTRNRLARLNPDGSVDGFDANADGPVNSTSIQADGRILIGGSFSTVGTSARSNVARVSEAGVVDTFTPNPNGTVYSTALQADGKVVLGGEFSIASGMPANRIVRVENAVATGSLVNPNSGRVQWLRGGASPETHQVTFEISTDGGSTWSLLGAGTRSRLVLGWELAGLNLPSSGLIRARARVLGGYCNASSGIVETIAPVGSTSAADIAIENPPLTLIPDAGGKSFGNLLVGSNSSLTFTVRNPSTASLSGLNVTVDGTNAAEFTITTAPLSTVAASGTTTFIVKFAPTTAGLKSAALHVASNVTNGKSPYDINLTGRALVASGDEDADGITNANELALVGLGFDPLINSSSLLSTIQSNALALGLYSASDMQTLALGAPLLTRDPATGHFHLVLSVDKSPTLSGWSPLLNFTPTYDPQTGKIDLDFTSGSGAQFYRVIGSKP